MPGGDVHGSEWQHYLSCHPSAHDGIRGCIHQPQTLVGDMPSIETLTFDITGLQDLVESRAIYVFSGRTIQMMLFCLLLDFHKSHSATGWLPGSMEIRIVGRDPSGEHTLLQLGPGYLRPVLDRSLDAENISCAV